MINSKPRSASSKKLNQCSFQNSFPLQEVISTMFPDIAMCAKFMLKYTFL